MTALTTRDALAIALLHVQHHENPDAPLPMVRSGCAGILADALLASGAVIDAATLVMPLFTAVVKATIDDPTGHLPNCGYTHENQTCGCAEYGKRLLSAITAALTKRGAQ